MAARGVVAGPRGYAAGFARVSPAGRYNCAAAVRGNYNHWGVYGRGWYTAHPGAWFAAGWAAGAAWNACHWDSLRRYCGYDTAQPVYYDYGNNVTYQDNSVYVERPERRHVAEQYYDQAASSGHDGHAGRGARPTATGCRWASSPSPRPDAAKSDVTIQLAVNKQGILRGNYTDTAPTRRSSSTARSIRARSASPSPSATTRPTSSRPDSTT